MSLLVFLFDGNVVNSHHLFYFKELSSSLIVICHCLTTITFLNFLHCGKSLYIKMNKFSLMWMLMMTIFFVIFLCSNLSCIVSISWILSGFMIILGLEVLDEVVWFCNMKVASSWWDHVFSCSSNNCEKASTMSSCEVELLDWNPSTLWFGCISLMLFDVCWFCCGKNWSGCWFWKS